MNENIPASRRRSIRLKGYDYTNFGAYFVTLVTWQRLCLFGQVANGEMRLNELGEIVVNTWMETAVVRYNVLLDAFVVMPNHVHGIIIINDGGVGAMRRIAPTAEQGYSRPTGAASGSLGAILGQIKSISTKRIKKLTQSTDNPVW